MYLIYQPQVMIVLMPNAAAIELNRGFPVISDTSSKLNFTTKVANMVMSSLSLVFSGHLRIPISAIPMTAKIIPIDMRKCIFSEKKNTEPVKSIKRNGMPVRLYAKNLTKLKTFLW